MSQRLEKVSQWGIIIIAIAAVFVSIWQVQIVHQHNRLTVRPLMVPIVVTNDSLIQTIHISNQGIGPSIIKSVSYQYDSQSYKNLNKVLMEAGIDDKVIHRFGFGEGGVLSPNNKSLILEHAKENGLMIGIEVHVVYRSIYEEEFELNFQF